MLDSLLDVLGLGTEDHARRVGVHIVMIWLTAWIAWQLVKRLSARIVALATAHQDATETLREKRAKTAAQLLRSTGLGVVVVLALAFTADQLGADLGKIFGLTAVFGLAISFGAQSLVKDYFNGFFILLEGQFVVGDSIEAAGKSGTVERLTLRTVRLRDLEGVVHIIPNGQIGVLSNKTRGWSRAVVDVGISYDNDIDGVIAVLKEVSKKFGDDATWAAKFDGQPEVLGVESFGDNGVTIRTLLRTKPGKQGEVAREFRRRVMIRLERAGIKGVRSQQTININNPPRAATAAAVPESGPPPSAPPDQTIPGSS